MLTTEYHETECDLFKLYFIDYAITVVSVFPTLLLLPPHSLRQSPPHCSCPWVMVISYLAPPFPMLYFTCQWLSCNCLFALLNSLTSSECDLDVNVKGLQWDIVDYSFRQGNIIIVVNDYKMFSICQALC